MHGKPIEQGVEPVCLEVDVDPFAGDRDHPATAAGAEQVVAPLGAGSVTAASRRTNP